MGEGARGVVSEQLPGFRRPLQRLRRRHRAPLRRRALPRLLRPLPLRHRARLPRELPPVRLPQPPDRGRDLSARPRAGVAAAPQSAGDDDLRAVRRRHERPRGPVHRLPQPRERAVDAVLPRVQARHRRAPCASSRTFAPPATPSSAPCSACRCPRRPLPSAPHLDSDDQRQLAIAVYHLMLDLRKATDQGDEAAMALAQFAGQAGGAIIANDAKWLDGAAHLTPDQVALLVFDNRRRAIHVQGLSADERRHGQRRRRHRHGDARRLQPDLRLPAGQRPVADVPP